MSFVDPSITHKTCTKCGEAKVFSEFHKLKNGKYGLRGQCKCCYNAVRKEKGWDKNYQAAHWDQILEYQRKWNQQHRELGTNWYASEAAVESRKKSYQKHAEIAKARSNEYYYDNKEEILAKAKQKRENNPLTEEQKEWRRQYTRAYYQQNKPAYYDYSVRRKRTIAEQTPGWANKEAILEIYRQCIDLNKESGCVAYHVDHIIPLNGDLVCGLHVETNLQIIEAEMNLKKGNKLCL